MEQEAAVLSPETAQLEAELLILKISDITECAVCLKTCSKPKFLPCLHTFCLECLQRIFQGKNSANCPLCRAKCTVKDGNVDGLPGNFFMEHVLEAREISTHLRDATHKCDLCSEDDNGQNEQELTEPARAYCGDCRQYMCDLCRRHHLKISSTKEHRVATVDGRRVPKEFLVSHCERHPKEVVKLYCLDCKEACCLPCSVGHHSSHKFKYIDEAVEEFCQQIQSDADEIAGAVQLSAAEESFVVSKTEVLCHECTIAKEDVERKRQELKNLIDRQADGLIKQIDEIKQRQTDESKRRNQVVTEHRLILENYRKYAIEVKETGTVSDIVKSAEELRDLTQKLKEQHEATMQGPFVSRHVKFHGWNNDLDLVGRLNMVEASSRGSDDVVVTTCQKTFSVGDVEIRIVRGDITDERTDAVVHSSSEKLEFHGELSSSILKKNGQQVQRVCEKFIGEAKDGIAVSPAGGLPSKIIIHIAAPQTPKENAWENIIMKCLKTADELTLKSIALPLVGTGKLKQPAAEMAARILNAIVQFSTASKPQNLKEIVIVVYRNEMVVEFGRELLKRKDANQIVISQ